MIYTEMTKRALALCYEAHREQRDRGGMPYVFHPFHLAEQMDDEDSTVAALLHDVVEDTPLTFEDLEREGFSPAVLAALRLLTHRADEPYLDYVARIRTNDIARKVKLADLRHNSDLTRLNAVGEKDIERVRKYARAMELLQE